MRHGAVLLALILSGFASFSGAVPVFHDTSVGMATPDAHASLFVKDPVVQNNDRTLLAQSPMSDRPFPSRSPGMAPPRAPSPPMTRIVPPPVQQLPRPYRPLPPPPPLTTGVVTVVQSAPVETAPPTTTIKHVTYPLVEPVLINPPAETAPPPETPPAPPPTVAPEPDLPPLTESPVSVTPPRDAPPPETSGHYEVRIMTTPSGERYEERVLVNEP